MTSTLTPDTTCRRFGGLVALLCILAVVPAAIANSGADISLPLGGYYRLGKFMPVSVAASLDDAGPDAYLALQADGAVEARLSLSDDGHAEGTAPLLMLDRSSQVRWSLHDGGRADAPGGVIDMPLRALDDDERLVGFMGPVDGPGLALARQFFPRRKIVTVRLDPARPLTGSTAAWQALDAVILDQPDVINQGMLMVLMAGDTVVAVQGPRRPELRWPWTRVGSYWVLRHSLRGPHVAGDNRPLFAPVLGWTARWPESLRWQLVFFSLVLCILLLASLIVPTRLRWLIAPVLCLIAMAAIGYWWRRQSPVLARVGQIAIHDGWYSQMDLWSYRLSASEGRASCTFLEMTWPMVQNPVDWRDAQLRLECREDGRPDSYTYRMLRDRQIAFVSRRVVIGASWVRGRPVEGPTPLTALAAPGYLQTGDTIIGSLRGTQVFGDEENALEDQRWGTLLIQAAGSTFEAWEP